MNAIVDEIKRLAPDYELSDFQLRQAAKAKDPEANASTFESRIAELRSKMSETLNIPDEVIEIGDLIDLLNLEHYVTGYGVLTYRYLLDKMDLKRILEMGREAGRLDNSNNDPFYCIYKEVLGREPDEGGYNFWKGHYDAGNLTLGEVITLIENSPEAKGEE